MRRLSVIVVLLAFTVPAAAEVADSGRTGAHALSNPDGLILYGGYGAAFEGRPAVFDVARLDWRLLPVTSESHLEAAAAEHDGVWYLIGGRGFHAAHEHVLALREGIVEPTAARLPEPRAAAAAAAAEGRVYIFGGATDGTPDDAILMFDPATDEVVRLEERLPGGRMDAVAWHHDGAIYLIGGVALGGQYAIDRFDVASQRVDRNWMGLPDLLRDFAAFELDGRLHLVGGWTGTRGWTQEEARGVHEVPFQKMWIFDPVAQEIVEAPGLPVPVYGAAGASFDGAGYLLAGSHERGARSHLDVWRFTPDEGWVRIYATPEPPATQKTLPLPGLTVALAFLGASVVRRLMR